MPLPEYAAQNLIRLPVRPGKQKWMLCVILLVYSSLWPNLTSFCCWSWHLHVLHCNQLEAHYFLFFLSAVNGSADCRHIESCRVTGRMYRFPMQYWACGQASISLISELQELHCPLPLWLWSHPAYERIFEGGCSYGSTVCG